MAKNRNEVLSVSLACLDPLMAYSRTPSGWTDAPARKSKYLTTDQLAFELNGDMRLVERMRRGDADPKLSLLRWSSAEDEILVKLQSANEDRAMLGTLLDTKTSSQRKRRLAFLAKASNKVLTCVDAFRDSSYFQNMCPHLHMCVWLVHV